MIELNQDQKEAIRYFTENNTAITVLWRKHADALRSIMEPEKPILNDFQRHCILYAKGWYERTDVIDDLGKIHNHVFIRSVGPVPLMYIMECVIELALLLKKHHVERTLCETWKNARERFSIDLKQENSMSPELFIVSLLSYIGATLGTNNYPEIMAELGEPDYSILPMPEIVRRKREQEQLATAS